MEYLARYWRFVRPFTLAVPAMGMVAGALVALGAAPKWTSDWASGPWPVFWDVAAGAILAAALNAFSNGINQIFDIEVDRVNKPHRLLPSGLISIREAAAVSLTSLILSVALAWSISVETTLIVGVAALLTYIYSAPPLRTKRRGIWANITIAIPRGTLLMVAGWSTVKSVRSIEPWLLGGILGAYFLGAVTTKDFSDMEGDRKGGCLTLPVKYGIEKTIRLISPFLIIPFAFLAVFALTGLLNGNRWILAGLGIGLAVWGYYITYLLRSTPPELFAGLNQSRSENHPSWKHMYLLTMLAQLGLVLAYLVA